MLYIRFEEAGELEPFLHRRYFGQWLAHTCNHHVTHVSEPGLQADHGCRPCCTDRFPKLSVDGACPPSFHELLITV